jgi:hypothetical protein
VSQAFSGSGVANELSLEVGTIVTLSFKKVAASIPHGVIGIFQRHNPSGRTMALELDSASNRNEYQEYFLGGKRGRCVGLTTLLPS